MISSRLPRFQRSSDSTTMQITDRDRQVIRLVHQHRFLRSFHICALLGGSQQQLLRRLQLLFHHGYLERPRSQLDYYHNGGSRHIVYGLGNRGAALLKQDGTNFRQHPESENNQTAGKVFLEHELLVSDVMVSLELACREQGIRLIAESELAIMHSLPPDRRPFKWKVKSKDVGTLGVIPDRVFALEFVDATGNPSRAICFLEADRGTMPVIRKNSAQTSFFRKLLAYEATWAQSLHESRFGFNRFRVLTVTTNAARVNSLLLACSKLESGKGLFLFTDRSILENPADILSPVWKTGKGGNGGLLD